MVFEVLQSFQTGNSIAPLLALTGALHTIRRSPRPAPTHNHHHQTQYASFFTQQQTQQSHRISFLQFRASGNFFGALVDENDNREKTFCFPFCPSSLKEIIQIPKFLFGTQIDISNQCSITKFHYNCADFPA